jgi:triosephosphate isomerase
MGGNWKLNPTTLVAAEDLTGGLVKTINSISNVDSIIFPPFPLISSVRKHIGQSRIAVS